MNLSKFALSVGRLAVSATAFLASSSNTVASVPGDEHWDNQFGPVGANDTLNAVTVVGGNVVIGGVLTAAGNVKASRIASYDGTNWHALNNGMGAGSGIFALAADGANLYAGGTFNNADNSGATNIARWDGSSWHPLDGGMSGIIFAIKIVGTNLYAGGLSTLAGGMTVNNIARWDGLHWSGIGGGVTGGLFTLVDAIESDGTNLYVAGSFTSAGGVSATNIARWDGNAWSALGPGLNGYVSALLFKGGKLYVGGNFTNANLGITNLAIWNPNGFQQWSSWGGANRRVRDIVANGTNIYVGGEFSTIGGINASRIARWDGNSWHPLGSGIQGFGIAGTPLNVFRIAIDTAGRLYAVGCFNIAGNVGVSHVAGWDGTNWFALGGTTSKGVTHFDGSVKSFCYDGTNLYVGGLFTEAGDVIVNGIAGWNGTNWSALGGGIVGNGVVHAVAKSGGIIYAGGTFTNMGGGTVKYVAQWDGANWSAMGNGFNGPVNALVVHKGVLFAGGSFDARGDGALLHGIAMWSGFDWQDVPRIDSWYGANSFYALFSDGTNLYAGGNFYIGWGFGPPNPTLGANVDNIGRWDGTNWWNLGTELNGTVSALTMQNGHLYAGGSFTNSSGTTVKCVARWDGNSWTAVGSGFDSGSVSALAATPTTLYAAGSFTNSGATPLNQIAEWDGVAWSSLGSGLLMNPGTAAGYALITVANDLYVGGLFIIAGDKPSMFIARWNDQLNFYPPPNLHLTHPAWLSNGQFRFRVAGTSGESYIIQGSTNLTTWTPLLTNSATLYDFTDASDPNLPLRYYRAMLGP